MAIRRTIIIIPMGTTGARTSLIHSRIRIITLVTGRIGILPVRLCRPLDVLPCPLLPPVLIACVLLALVPFAPFSVLTIPAATWFVQFHRRNVCSLIFATAELAILSLLLFDRLTS